MKWLKKVATTPLTTIAKVINSLAGGENETTNAPSIKAVKDALELKQDFLNFDSTPTSGSTNPVTSDGIYTSLDVLSTNIEEDLAEITSYDTEPTSDSNKAVSSDGLKTFMDSFFDQIYPYRCIIWLRDDTNDPNETLYRGTWTQVGRYTYHYDTTDDTKVRIFYAWQRMDII